MTTVTCPACGHTETGDSHHPHDAMTEHYRTHRRPAVVQVRSRAVPWLAALAADLLTAARKEPVMEDPQHPRDLVAEDAAPTDAVGVWTLLAVGDQRRLSLSPAESDVLTVALAQYAAWMAESPRGDVAAGLLDRIRNGGDR